MQTDKATCFLCSRLVARVNFMEHFNECSTKGGSDLWVLVDCNQCGEQVCKSHLNLNSNPNPTLKNLTTCRRVSRLMILTLTLNLITLTLITLTLNLITLPLILTGVQESRG